LYLADEPKLVLNIANKVCSLVKDIERKEKREVLALKGPTTKMQPRTMQWQGCQKSGYIWSCEWRHNCRGQSVEAQSGTVTNIQHPDKVSLTSRFKLNGVLNWDPPPGGVMQDSQERISANVHRNQNGIIASSCERSSHSPD